MRPEFLRADFRWLIGDGQLLDGNELSIGFVRIAADGLYSTYEAAYGEKPALDMNFNPGKAVLPFPFTLEQFKAFCAWHPLFIPEIIESRFTNDDATIDNEALAELDDRSLLAGTLVRSILGIPVEAEAEVALDEPAKTEPVVVEGASGGVVTGKTEPVDKGWVMKKSALIAKHIHQWATIERDFRDSGENLLSSAAKAPGHGNWFEAAALDWADQRGKRKIEKQQDSANIATVWNGEKHKIVG